LGRGRWLLPWAGFPLGAANSCLRDHFAPRRGGSLRNMAQVVGNDKVAGAPQSASDGDGLGSSLPISSSTGVAAREDTEEQANISENEASFGLRQIDGNYAGFPAINYMLLHVSQRVLARAVVRSCPPASGCYSQGGR
jgi:hypothetical protein